MRENQRSKIGGAVLAAIAPLGACLFEVPCWADGVNLIVNGNAETGVGGDGYTVVPPPGWVTTSNFTVLKWGLPGGFPLYSNAAPPNPGENLFGGGTSTAVSEAVQDLQLMGHEAAVSSGTEPYRLSGWLGGYASQEDNMVVTATFSGVNSETLGVATIGPVTAAERGFNTGLLYREAQGVIPKGTVGISITMVATRLAGSYDDGYADEIRFELLGGCACPSICPCSADLTADGSVGADDLATLLGSWGACGSCPADVDCDGAVGPADLATLLGSWGACPP